MFRNVRASRVSSAARATLISVLLWLAAAAPALAQATATLSGTVIDESDAVIPKAAVSMTNTATRLERQTTTGNEGQFTMPLLPPGRYVLRVERDGFTPIEVPEVVLNVNDEITIRLQMKIDAIGETVSVAPDLSRLISTAPSVSTVVDRQFVENLPLNGRSFHSLLELTPGTVVAKTGSGGAGQFSVNGQRTDANYFMVDGVSANSGTQAAGPLGQSGGGALPALTAFGSMSSLVSVDAMQEFRVETSTFAPEFGRSPGAQVSIVTRSGSNDYRGSLFDYVRNDKFDANDWFANSRNLAKPPLRQHDFGGVLGGPVVTNRTFFFFSYEGLRLRQPNVLTAAVPSQATRDSAPASLRPFLEMFPKPNGRDLGGGREEFSASYSDPSRLDATSLRVDQMVRSSLTLFGRFNAAPSSTSARAGAGAQYQTTEQDTMTLTVGATMILRPWLSNDLRVNRSTSDGSIFTENDDFGGAARLPDQNLFPLGYTRENGSFSIQALGLSIGAGAYNFNEQRQTNIVNTLSLVAGTHQLKFGVDYRQLSPSINISTYNLQPVYNTLESIRSGIASSVRVSNFAPRRELTYANVSLFAQDHWRASNRLTLTYGVRWDHNPPPGYRGDAVPYRVENLDRPAALTLGEPGAPLYDATWNNFAPRVGAAYRLFADRPNSAIVRGGLGLFYDLGNGPISNAVHTSAFPFRATANYTNVAFPLSTALATPPALTLDPPVSLIYVADPNLALPRTTQWNVAFEQPLGSNQSVSATYVGAAGRELLRLEVLRAPNPTFTLVNVATNTASSDYRALQLQFVRRLSRGFQTIASYTWSQSTDNASSDSTGSAPSGFSDPELDRGPSDFDIRHTFVAAATYHIPASRSGLAGAIFGDWALDTIVRARSGAPLNVIVGTDVFNIGVTDAARPDLVAGRPVWIDDPLVANGRRLNRDAFQAPTGRQGNLGRNALRGFGLAQVDLSVSRRLPITSAASVQFRVDVFNVLNHPLFGDPVNSLANAQFGLSTSMLGRSLGTGGQTGGFNPLYQIGGPRSVQLAAKLQF